MTKLAKNSTQLDFSGDPDPLRAQDIPYSATESVKDKLDGLSAGAPIINGVNSLHFGFVSARHNTAAMESLGLFSSMSYSDESTSFGVDQQGIYFSQVGTNFSAGWNTNATTRTFRRDQNPKFTVKFKTPAAHGGSFFRSFIGLGNSLSTVVDADTPSSTPSLGLQFCKNRGDTTFKVAFKGFGGSFSLQDTTAAYAFDTVYYLTIEFDPVTTYPSFKLFDVNKTQVGTTVTMATASFLPQLTQPLAFIHAAFESSAAQDAEIITYFANAVILP